MKHNRLKPFFRAAVQTDGTLELLVYEEIGENWWSGGGVTAKSVKERIDSAGVFNRIAVRINSPGGDAFEGVAVFNLLRAQGKPIDVYVDGIAASAASIVAMAGDVRMMGSNAMMMIHNAWSSCVGYAEDMRKMADTLDKVSLAVAQTYIDRAKLSAEDVKAMMDAESWLGAQECFDKGLATAIVGNEGDPAAAEAMALARSFKSLSRLKTVPEVLRNQACGCPCDSCANGDCMDCNCGGCESEDCGADACNCANNLMDKVKVPADLSIFEAELELVEMNLR
jgi:ATP-dependent protease ClpP protease subunit